mgnify:CR=1 FL=1
MEPALLSALRFSQVITAIRTYGTLWGREATGPPDGFIAKKKLSILAQR